MNHIQLDEMDEKILHMLTENARIPFLEVARACGVSGTAIHQRVQRLTNLGVLQGTEYKVNPSKIGYETCAYIGLYLKDETSLDAVTEALAQIPEVVEGHYTNEDYDLFVKVYARNNEHLQTIIRKKLMPLGVSHSRVIISFRQVLQKQIAMPADLEEEKIAHFKEKN
ncbi:MAG: AsnC family transcriptional regulator [Bacteroides sp.]|nr:AsnC family transcriptional regulator [Bacteroides sp.]